MAEFNSPSFDSNHHDVHLKAETCSLGVVTDITNLSSFVDSNLINYSMENRQDTAKKLDRLSRISKKQKQRFARFFPEVAMNDAAIKSFHCALVTDILYQGFLYITPNWICFYSNVFRKRRIQIPMKAVVSLSKKKTAMFIPNAVGVTTANQEYVFGSLISRENTYKVMKKVWLLWQSISFGMSKDVVCTDTNMETCSLTSQANESNIEQSLVGSISTTENESDDDFVDALNYSDCAPSAHCDDAHNKDVLPTFTSKFQSNYLLNGYLLNCMLEIYKLPRTCLFLGIACILTVFLLISSITFTIHLSTLQDSIETTCDASSFSYLYRNSENIKQQDNDHILDDDLQSLHTQLVSKMDVTLTELLKITQNIAKHKHLQRC